MITVINGIKPVLLSEQAKKLNLIRNNINACKAVKQHKLDSFVQNGFNQKPIK